MKTKAVRKRQPQVTRRHILDVVGDLILEKGIAAVTLDAVSEAAGVSKGGLLHHFPNKKALIDEFVADGSKSFQESIQQVIDDDPVTTGRNTRAELRTIADSHDIRCACLWTALLATRPEENGDFHSYLRQHFYKIMHGDAADSEINVVLAIVYLAADGLAIADLAGIFDEKPDLRAKIVSTLEAITHHPQAFAGETPVNPAPVQESVVEHQESP